MTDEPRPSPRAIACADDVRADDTPTDPGSAQPADRTGRRQWASVTAVAFCVFTLVLSEFLPIGLLTDITGGLHISAGTAGLLVVMPGLAATVAGPAAALLAGRLDRRWVLVGLAAVIAASNLIAALGPDLATVLGARALLGVGVGGFWVFAVGVAPRLVDAAGATRATAVVTGGISVATVASLPVGALVGSLAGWRVVFGLGAALAVVGLVAQLVLLPALPSRQRNTARMLLGILRLGSARTVLIASVATFVAQFAAYTYLEPYLAEQVGLDVGQITGVLLGFGVAGLAGNFGFTRLVDRSPRRAVVLFLGLVAVAVAVLPWVAAGPVAAVAVVLLWGVAWGALPLSLQVFMMRGAGAAAEAGQAAYVAVVQISLAAGSALGGLVVDRSGLTAAFGLAAVVGLLGCLVASLRRAVVETVEVPA